MVLFDERGEIMGLKASIMSLLISAECSLGYYLFATKLDYDNKLLISIVILLAVMIIAFGWQNLKYAYYNFALKKKDNSKQISCVEKCIKSTMDTSLELRLTTSLSKAYIKKGDYQNALEVLTDKSLSFSPKNVIKYFGSTKSLKLEYYIKCIYLYIISNNLIKAQECFENGKALFDNERVSDKHNTEILHVKAMMEYSKGNYAISEGLAIQGKGSSPSKKQLDEFDYIIGKCYVRTSRTEDGITILKRLMNKSSDYQVSQASRQFLIKIDAIRG